MKPNERQGKVRLEYLGYVGSIEYSEKDKAFHGRIVGIKDLITYEGENEEALISDFHNAIDEYFKYCELCAKHFREGLDRDYKR